MKEMTTILIHILASFAAASTCNENFLPSLNKPPKCQEEITEKVFHTEHQVCHLDTKCKTNSEHKECNEIFFYDSTNSHSDLFNQMQQINPSIKRRYSLQQGTVESVLIVVVDETNIGSIDCTTINGAAYTVLPVYFGEIDLVAFPNELQNEENVLVDGTADDAATSIDMFSRFFANCPEMCEASCHYDESDKTQECVRNNHDGKGDERTCCGPVGADGERGPRGNLGRRGCPGQPGEGGEPGELGEQGERGLRGPSGKTGSNGPKGQPGIPGQKGETGNPGHSGEPGESGAPGNPGYDGRQGAFGPPGVSNGELGPRGNKGPQGPTGLLGERGQKGQPGITSHSSQVLPADRDELFMSVVFDLLENDPDIKLAFNDAASKLPYKPFCNCMH